jgi:hypothetical protein
VIAAGSAEKLEHAWDGIRQSGFAHGLPDDLHIVKVMRRGKLV